MTYKVDQKERDAVMAALRLLQVALDNRTVLPNDGDIGDILTCSGQHEALTASEVDSLCELMSFEEVIL